MLGRQVGRQIGTIDQQIAEELTKRCWFTNLHPFDAHALSFRKRLRIIRHDDPVMNHAFQFHDSPLYR